MSSLYSKILREANQLIDIWKFKDLIFDYHKDKTFYFWCKSIEDNHRVHIGISKMQYGYGWSIEREGLIKK